jgi:hypothetical protein
VEGKRDDDVGKVVWTGGGVQLGESFKESLSTKSMTVHNL